MEKMPIGPLRTTQNRATLIYNYGTKIEVREANEIITVQEEGVNSRTAAPAPKPIDKAKASKVLKILGK